MKERISMKTNYHVVPIKRSLCRNDLVALFEQARNYFIHRRFFDALQLMQEANTTCNEKFLPAVRLNLALFHHVLGHQAEAESLYEQSSDTPVKLINYHAFCHRYFCYEKCHAAHIGKNEPLQQIFEHNEFNRQITVNEIFFANLTQASKQFKNIFYERLLNDFYFKIGHPQKNFFRNMLVAEVRAYVENFKKSFISTEKNRIGIYVNDIQRHKESALIYDLISVLPEENFVVYLYFDNIFDNKLVQLLPAGITLRHTVNLGILAFNNLIAEDKIFALLDLTGNKMRTRLPAVSMQRKNVLNLDEIFFETPLPLQSEIYFGAPVDCVGRTNNVAVIGDLKYISNVELSQIKNTMSDKNLIFMSFAFCEELFRKNFERRLIECGINRFQILEGIRPFRKYLEFLASVSAAVVTSGASVAELSEVLFVDTPVILLSPNPILKQIATAKSLNHMRSVFVENLRGRLKNISSDTNCKYIFDEELRLQYRHDEATFEVNMSCNGDLLVFAEPVR